MRRHPPSRVDAHGRLTGAVIAAAMCLIGCGYEHQRLYPKQVSTVAVPIFENRTFYRDIERYVTEALIKHIELATPYKVVDAGHADTMLTGSITSISQARLSRRRKGGLPQEIEFRIKVDFEWKDLRSGQTMRQRRGFVAIGRQIPARPVSEPMETAQHHAADRLARAIVVELGENW